MVLKGYDKPATSKKYGYMTKPEVEAGDKKPKRGGPGPQQYLMNHGLTEARPKGGSAAFGMSRDKFLQRQEDAKKKQHRPAVVEDKPGAATANSGVPLNPKLDVIRPNYNRTAVAMRKPTEKKKYD